jgi:hypothetical protein
VPKIVVVTWTCDACGKELAETDALLARLPLGHGAPGRLHLGRDGLAPTAGEVVYWSWECLQQDVAARASSAA